MSATPPTPPASFPLTRSQILLWTGQKLNAGVPLYNMVLTFTIEGPVDPVRFQRAFQRLLDQADALRLVVTEHQGTPTQRIRPPYPFTLPFHDLTRHPAPREALDEWVTSAARHPFDLAQGLFDTALLRTGPTTYVWYLNQHHLITDGWSVAQVYRYMVRSYHEETLPPLPAYRDYVAFEQDHRQTPWYDKAMAYWQQKTHFPAQPLVLYGRTAHEESSATHRVTFDLGPDRSQTLRAMAAYPPFRSLTPHLSLFNLFATTLFVWLYRVSGQPALGMGTPAHNRATTAFKETIGVFIELFPFEVTVDPGETFATLHSKVSHEAKHFLRYAQPGISDPAHHNRFHVVLNYINASFPDFGGYPMQSEWVHAGHGDPRHHLRLQVHDFDASGAIQLHFDFNTERFDPPFRQQAIDHFVTLLDACLQQPDAPLTSLSLLTPAAETYWIKTFNRTSAPVLPAQTVVDLFEARAAATPDAIALQFQGQAMTYATLNARANYIAHRLRQQDGDTAAPAGIYLSRSPAQVAALLGILKAGRPYVPLDPLHPSERTAFVLADTGATTILSEPRYQEELSPHHVVLLLADSDSSAQPSPPSRAIVPSDTAYILYTSGSTGTPKGVVITHEALAHYVTWASTYYAHDAPVTFPFFSPLTFDLTITSLWLPLLTGGTVVIYPESTGALDLTLLDVLADDAVDIIKLTPAHLALAGDRIARCQRLKALILGGEDLPRDLAESVTTATGGRLTLWNEYGPTEATVGCIVHRFDPKQDRGPSVPIGTPIDRMQAYVLDAHLQPVPPGLTGNLYLSGTGLAQAYLNQPDLTDAAFLPHPFLPDTRLYRTGDQARIHPAGYLEYLGRTDRQVKVRGARIELGEIEAVLHRHPAVQTGVAIVYEHTPDEETSAFYCVRCGLPSNYPGASYDEDGLCHLCRSFATYEQKTAQYFQPTEALHTLLQEARQRKTGNYDAMMLLSGGKDSTYALYQLVVMGWQVRAFTLDNGYLSGEAKANIRRVVEALEVDHVFATTPAMQAIFVDSLRRHSNVCNGCFKALYTLAIQEAHTLGIPMIVTGLSRGQFFETRLTEELFHDHTFSPERIDLTILDARKAYHRVPDAVSEHLDVSLFADDAIFDAVQFVDFYRYCDVPLEEMLAFLDHHAPWVRPSDTGRSTNCLINDAGIYVHQQERGFHNYAFPYSWDVRTGHKTRNEALDELHDALDMDRVQAILDELGYTPERRAAHTTGKQLVAYYVAEATLTPAALQQHLKNHLPAFMVPAVLIPLEHLPLTPHGKVDRGALPPPLPSRTRLNTAYVAPRTDLETALTAIWEAVLPVEKIGIHDDFLSIGGHSLLAIQIVTRVNEAFGINLSLQRALQTPTVATLAEAVEDTLLAEIESMTDDEAEALLRNT